MLKIGKLIITCLILVGFTIQRTEAQSFADDLNIETSGQIYEIKIEGMIDNALASYIHRALNEAQNEGAAAVLFEIDTFGGEVDAADRIRKTILNAEIPTIAVIDKNAASAGALISLATDKIVMVPGSSIGAATVVQGGTGEAAPDKYQSYMRGLMRATAEAKGKNPAIAEAMVDESLEVEGVSEKGKVLTLSASEALELGIADAILKDKEEVISSIGVAADNIVVHTQSRLDKLFRFFGSPVVQSILMMMMLSGLYFELQSPGIGFAGMMSLVGALMFFAPNYMGGLVESWEIVLFFVGILLLAAEIFVIPGFGVAGILGILMVLVSLFTALIGNVGLDLPSTMEINSAIITLTVTLILVAVLIGSLSRYLPETKAFNRLVLAPELSSADGYVANETDFSLVGKSGTTLTVLRPAGTMMVDGKRVDVVSEGGFISEGVTVKVIDVIGNRVQVRATESLQA